MPVIKSLTEVKGEKLPIPATFWIITRAEGKIRSVKNNQVLASQLFFFSGYKDKKSCDDGERPLSQEEINIKVDGMQEEDENNIPVKLENNTGMVHK